MRRRQHLAPRYKITKKGMSKSAVRTMSGTKLIVDNTELKACDKGYTSTGSGGCFRCEAGHRWSSRGGSCTGARRALEPPLDRPHERRRRWHGLHRRSRLHWNGRGRRHRGRRGRTIRRSTPACACAAHQLAHHRLEPSKLAATFSRQCATLGTAPQPRPGIDALAAGEPDGAALLIWIEPSVILFAK